MPNGIAVLVLMTFCLYMKNVNLFRETWCEPCINIMHSSSKTASSSRRAAAVVRARRREASSRDWLVEVSLLYFLGSLNFRRGFQFFGTTNTKEASFSDWLEEVSSFSLLTSLLSHDFTLAKQ